MKSTITVSVVGCLLVGGILAGVYASKNASSAAATSRALIVSMINPSDAISSPRTYNQTLVETINTAELVDYLQQLKLPVSGVTFDVLPDSFHIQTTATLSEASDEKTNTAVATAITATLASASEKLTTTVFIKNVPQPTAVVTLTKVLPQELSIQQSPAGAAVYGAIAGAIFGWFVGLTLADQKRRR